MDHLIRELSILRYLASIAGRAWVMALEEYASLVRIWEA